MSGSKIRYLNRMVHKNYSIRYFLNFYNICKFSIKNIIKKNNKLIQKYYDLPYIYRNEISLKKIYKNRLKKPLLFLYYKKHAIPLLHAMLFRITHDYYFYTNETTVDFFKNKLNYFSYSLGIFDYYENKFNKKKNNIIFIYNIFNTIVLSVNDKDIYYTKKNLKYEFDVKLIDYYIIYN